MRLIESYANNIGIKTPKEGVNIYDNFIPTPDKYISFYIDKNHYIYLQEVVSLISPILQKYDIKIVTFGNYGLKLQNAISFIGNLSFSHSCHVVKNSLCHIDHNSRWLHVAGNCNVSIVGLFGPTDNKTNGPYYFNKDKSIFLESDRNGNKPSYLSSDLDRTINLIKIEDICNSILKLLDIEEKVQIKSKFVGSNYNDFIFEICPDKKTDLKFSPDTILNIRYDYNNNLENLCEILDRYKSTIVTKTPIPFNILLGYRENITCVVYKIESVESLSVDFVKFLHYKSFNYRLVAAESMLGDLRNKLFDYNPVFQEPSFKNIEFAGLPFKSSRVLISGNQVFLSKWHYDNNLPQENLADLKNIVPDTQDLTFIENQSNFFIYETI